LDVKHIYEMKHTEMQISPDKPGKT